MALEFLSDAEVGDAELVVRFDLEGVEAMLAAMHTALEAGSGPMAAGTDDSETDPAAPPLHAFGSVSFRFLDSPAPAGTLAN